MTIKLAKHAQLVEDNMVRAIQQESLETLYYIGHSHYRQGKYADAESIFGLLTLLGRRDHKHWIALGGAYQMQKKYRDAINAYREVDKLNGADPIANFHTAECYFALGEKDSGLIALECAERALKIEVAPDQDMLAHIALMKSAWTANNNK